MRNHLSDTHEDYSIFYLKQRQKSGFSYRLFRLFIRAVYALYALLFFIVY